MLRLVVAPAMLPARDLQTLTIIAIRECSLPSSTVSKFDAGVRVCEQLCVHCGTVVALLRLTAE